MNKNENAANEAEKNNPAFSPDFAKDAAISSRIAEKCAIWRDLCQEGEVLRAFWINPNEENLREALLDLAPMLANGQRGDAKQLVDSLLLTNCNAAKQFLRDKLEWPDQAASKNKAPINRSLLSKLGIAKSSEKK